MVRIDAWASLVAEDLRSEALRAITWSPIDPPPRLPLPHALEKRIAKHAICLRGSIEVSDAVIEIFRLDQASRYC
jgi:hypothetical protein